LSLTASGDKMETVLDDAKVQHKIRLHGIDAPEKGQAFGTKARENLAAKVFGKIVRIEVVDVDRYRREVGRIYLGDRFINLEIVRDGFAWRYLRYDKAGEFTEAEREAERNAAVCGRTRIRCHRGNGGGRIDGRRRVGRESAVPKGNVGAVTRASRKVAVQRRLRVVARRGISLIHRSDRCTLDIDGVDQRRPRIHLGNVGLGLRLCLLPRPCLQQVADPFH
jgi:hypothetical protein